MAKELNVTLVRSLIGTKPLQRKNVEALGLKKIRQTVKHSDTPQIRGAIEKVKHLVKVEEI